jgi:dipeptidyl aminopeptidase/acylaminoacyl peptidase
MAVGGRAPDEAFRFIRRYSEGAMTKATRHSVTLALLGGLALVGCVPESRTAAASANLMALGFGAPRPARAGESAFEDTLPLLREPENSNVVPGPRGLVAFMKPDPQHHPRLYLKQQTESDSMRLLIDRYATNPRWAPVGERLACTVWKSRTFPWSLCIVSLGRADTLYPLPHANAVRYRWSPDAKYLAVSATLPGGTASVLYLVDTRTGQYRAVDTLQVYSDYDLGWSPDSRMVAASRPTRLANMEEIAEAEIWIYDLAGQRLQVVSAQGRANLAPRWVDARRLLFTREDPNARGRETFVVELVASMK